jgi:NAD(P)-dependent dehydrogenase (short-subunit alcohol dehydrogenase family)
MQTILITGAGSGIGAATAKLLSKNKNTRLILVGRRLEPLRELKSQLDNSESHLAKSIDISVTESLTKFLESPEADLNTYPLVSVFANAGIGGPNTFGPMDRWNEIIDINLTGTYNTCMITHPWLVKAKEAGHTTRNIVITSSCLARFGVPGQTAYVASKTALLGLVRSLATSWSSDGLLINAINPGWVETEMAQNSIQAMAYHEGVSYEAMHKQQCAILPTGRMSQPEEVAALVQFLFSDAQKSITGQAIDINGGSWMG